MGLQLLLPGFYPAFPLRSKMLSSTGQRGESVFQAESLGSSWKVFKLQHRPRLLSLLGLVKSLQMIRSYRLRFDWTLANSGRTGSLSTKAQLLTECWGTTHLSSLSQENHRSRCDWPQRVRSCPENPFDEKAGFQVLNPKARDSSHDLVMTSDEESAFSSARRMIS